VKELRLFYYQWYSNWGDNLMNTMY